VEFHSFLHQVVGHAEKAREIAESGSRFESCSLIASSLSQGTAEAQMKKPYPS